MPAFDWRRSATVTAPALLLLLAGWSRRWVCDDAFIDLRVVQQLWAGHGWVFNASERVEAITNPLWVALLAATGGLLDHLWPDRGLLEWSAVLLGLVAATAGVALGLRATQPVDAPAARWPVGALLFVSLPPVWDFATSGLETGLAVLWLGASYLALQRHWSAAGWLWSLGPLVRPDLALYAVALAVADVATTQPRSLRRWLKAGLQLAALPVAVQVWRMGYYGALLPNTALAKEAGLPNWPQGWHYLWDFLQTYGLWLPLPLALATLPGIAATQKAETGAAAAGPGHGSKVTGEGDPPATANARWEIWRARAPMLAAGVHALYLVRVGGDFMHARLYLPALLALLLPVFSVPRPLGVRATATKGLLVYCAALWLLRPAHPPLGPHSIADERRYYISGAGHPNPITLADHREQYGVAAALRLRERAKSEPGLVHVSRNIGFVGLAAGPDVHVVDLHGLADPVGARLRLAERGRPGHEKLLANAWVTARWPHWTGQADAAEVAAARAALQCGALSTLRAAIEDPLTFDRFLSNVKGAAQLTALRIAPEPQAAQRELCGPAHP